MGDFRMSKLLRSLVAVAFFAANVATANCEELAARLKIIGNEVELHVHHKDGSPATGVQVRLLDAGQRTTAASRTDEHGRWFTAVRSPGRYQAIVEGESDLTLPFTVIDIADARPIPWSTLGLGLACCLGAAFLFISGIRKPAAMGLFVVAGVGFLSWSAWVAWFKPMPLAFTDGPNIAKEARAYLRERNIEPLSEPLAKLLAEIREDRIRSQPHPLLGKAAPAFALIDHKDAKWDLNERLKKGPVVLVFYYGYHCNHCVGQLFALQNDAAKFRELGAEIIAVSADPPELTRARFKQYGEFAFPVLADPGNKIAQAYGVYQPASGKTPENLQHGTFIIGRDGLVHWTQYGDEPFTGNRTLLYEIAKLEARLP